MGKDSVFFYTGAAEGARSPEAAAVFAQIAAEEKTHVVTVQASLQQHGG